MKSYLSRNKIYMLFLLGYVMMGLIVNEQGRTIENQRVLIRSLFSDSSQLTSIKMDSLQKR